MRVIIVNGTAGSGKDSLVTLCAHYLDSYSVHNLSTIDEVKKIAESKFGWDLEKDEKGRQLLSDLKKAWTAYNGGPARQIFGTVKRYVLEEMALKKQHIIFIHCREPEEIDQFISDFAAEGIPTMTVLVKRPDVQIYTNDADAGVENFAYDFIINNDGDWQKLETLAKAFAKEIIEWKEETWDKEHII